MEPTEQSAGRTLRRPRWRWIILGALLVLALLWCVRLPVLRSVGAFLVDEDPLTHADVCFVLGGGALDRGKEAAVVSKAGFADRFLFTGGDLHGELALVGVHLTEAELGREVALAWGLPPEQAGVIEQGTSTMEEALATLERARLDGVDTVMVISSRLHLRRVGRVFRDRFASHGITVLLHGAKDHRFDERSWWTREEGLLMVNNEYVKLVYYALKY